MTELNQGAKEFRGDNKKFDGDKDPWDLVPWLAMVQVVKVYLFGAKMHGANTWQDVDNARARYFAACMRHLTDRQCGEIYARDSGLYHYAHAIWNLLALLWFDITDHRAENRAEETKKKAGYQISYCMTCRKPCNVKVEKLAGGGWRTISECCRVSVYTPPINEYPHL